METTEPRTIYQHYEVQRRQDGSLHELGRGAMGITYKAFDTNLHVPVALKVITGVLLPDAKARTRFLREARAAAQLRHSNVATVYHLGQEADFCFYTMEFVDGDTLEARIRRDGPMNAATALHVCQQTARALQAAHARGLLHRDLKPSNLMLTTEGEEMLVKVIDFGLVKPLQQDSADASSASLSGGLFLGTPLYASPEQCASEDAIDGRSDLYSLGATLWFMLTGGPPFKGSVRTVMTQHLTRPPAFETLAGQPLPVVGLLRDLLAKDAAERPANAAELRARLAEILPALESSAKVTAPGASAPSPPPLPSSIFRPDEVLRRDPPTPPLAGAIPIPALEADSSQTLAAGSFSVPPVPPAGPPHAVNRVPAARPFPTADPDEWAAYWTELGQRLRWRWWLKAGHGKSPLDWFTPGRPSFLPRRPRFFGRGGTLSRWMAKQNPVVQLLARAGMVILVLKLITLPFSNSEAKKQARKHSSAQEPVAEAEPAVPGTPPTSESPPEESASSSTAEDAKKSTAKQLEKLNESLRNADLPIAAKKTIEDAIRRLTSPTGPSSTPPAGQPMIPPLPLPPVPRPAKSSSEANTREQNLETAREKRAAARELKRQVLDAKHKSGQLSDSDYQEALDQLSDEDE